MRTKHKRRIELIRKILSDNKGRKELIGVWVYHVINPKLSDEYKLSVVECGNVFGQMIRLGFPLVRRKTKIGYTKVVEYEVRM